MSSLLTNTAATAPETEPTVEPTVEPTSTGPESTGILPPSHWAQVQHDDTDDGDSAFEDDNASSTASLSASILEYRVIHGRTYHSERGNAQSWNPNDALHDESMEILHHVSTLMQDGKLLLAPIRDDVQKVLDVATGVGMWAIDFADDYPGAEVIGVDISPQKPQWIPPNLRFEVEDVTLPWTYQPNSFDYIHLRWLTGCVEDWNGFYREIYKALKPGGYFEHKESTCLMVSDDGTVTENSALSQWGRVFTEAGRKLGRTFSVVEDGLQVKGMKEAGFEIVLEKDLKTPIGPWPEDENQKLIGQFSRLALDRDIEGYLNYIWTKVMGWSTEEIAVYAAHLRRELRSPNIHAYYAQKVVVARKPEKS
ncbi:S-adenosyl-L-methionine-dependent methyltransferase [Hypoxylon trugodes]|uniref:S-adenosyl-L-methionine-dependent methyltransferase n=1 Tax=Hypoxylon trugodes TaxID=326681 RepID=UPI0021971EAD|nr:S-adenosyl-L-methionine-dependent methyltransferase [Hypoxylon trugodes]KAI1393036.1 S-adenosyl-L-methionine-dependent methyltransferase [Hypoxylon trugodes]